MKGLSPNELLKRYWGYDAFRPLQLEIIESVLSGNDTLALLPTGGGKSVCFQVPAMALEGVCLVISPLIALMKDQVEQLKKKGISAQGLYSGMTYKEIQTVLDQVVNAEVKFLYLSPERLQTPSFKDRLPYMKVGLLAIDEAHCISQWGFDFRPPYRQILELREFLPETPVIALTATATPRVRQDILEQLGMAKAAVFVKSFARSNLSYSVLKEERMEDRIISMLRKIPGTAIIYVRSRAETQRLSLWLQRQGFSAEAYHAGLNGAERDKRQSRWILNQTRVMVATNAFGMGIDKPDVRLVIHTGLPESLEAYYQEAGRAGRDEKKAFAVLLWDQAQAGVMAEKIERSHPSEQTIRSVYQWLSSYFQLAAGSGMMNSFPFHLEQFAKTFKIKSFEAFSSIKKLEELGFIQLNEAFTMRSRLLFLVNAEETYRYQVAHQKEGLFIKFILRMYGGEAYSQAVQIDEDDMMRRYKVPRSNIIQMLNKLGSDGIIEYVPSNEQPLITYLSPRHLADELPIDKNYLRERKQDQISKAQAVIDYASTTHTCRTVLLLRYFGEDNDSPCGVCDVCVHQKREEEQRQKVRSTLLRLLAEEALPMVALVLRFPKAQQESLEAELRHLMDEGRVKIDGSGYLRLINP
jgi:ATP-dependent DNA helicase RecQ